MEAATAEAKTAAMEATAMDPPPKPPRASAAVGVRAPSAATVARAIIVLRNMTTSLHNVRGHKRCRRRIVALWRAEQELNSPATGKGSCPSAVRNDAHDPGCVKTPSML